MGMLSDDRILLERFRRDRDGEAFAELMRRYGAWVYGVCLRACRDQATAEDATQECFLELARQAHRVRDSLPGWLQTVARRIATRLRARAAVTLTDAAAVTVSGDEHERSDIDDLGAALTAMSPDLRLLLIARYVDGLGQQAIAERFGITQGAVSRRLARALDEMRQRMHCHDQAWTVALAALHPALPASLHSRLADVAARAPSVVAPTSAVSMVMTIALTAIASAAIAIPLGLRGFSAAVATTPASPPISSPLPAPSTANPPAATDLLLEPVTVTAANWPLIEVIHVMRERLPVGSDLVMVPDPDVCRVDAVFDGMPLCDALDAVVRQTPDWRWQRIGDCIVLDHALAAPRHAALDAALRGPAEGRPAAARALAASGDLTAAAAAISAWAADDGTDLGEAVLGGLSDLLRPGVDVNGETAEEPSPLMGLRADPAAAASLERAWRRSLVDGLVVTPFFCHLCGAAGVHALEPDLLQLVDKPLAFMPGLDPSRRVQLWYRDRVRQQAIRALGALLSPAGLMRMHAILRDHDLRTLHGACLEAIADARDLDARDAVLAVPVPLVPAYSNSVAGWSTFAGWANAMAVVAPKELVLAAERDADRSLATNLAVAARRHPVPDLLRIMFNGSPTYGMGWEFLLSGYLPSPDAVEPMLRAAYEAHSEREGNGQGRELSAALLAALGDRTAWNWLLAAADDPSLPGWNFINALWFAAPRAPARLVRESGDVLRQRLRPGEAPSQALLALNAIRDPALVDAVAATLPTLSDRDRAFATNFLLLDGSAHGVQAVVDYAPIRVWGMLPPLNLINRQRLEAAARWDTDALLSCQRDEIAAAATARFEALPADRVTSEIVSAVCLGNVVLDGPQTSLAAKWLRTAADQQGRMRAAQAIHYRLGHDLDCDQLRSLLLAVADSLEHETDAEVRGLVVAVAQRWLGDRGWDCLIHPSLTALRVDRRTLVADLAELDRCLDAIQPPLAKALAAAAKVSDSGATPADPSPANDF